MKKAHYPFRFSSMFGQTLLVLLALTLVIGAFFYHFVSRLYERQYVEKQADIRFSWMKEIGSRAEQVFSAVSAKMETLLGTQDCSRLLVAGEELLQPQTLNVIQELAGFTAGDEGVESAWLYLPYARKVLSSDRTVMEVESRLDSVYLEKETGVVVKDGAVYYRKAYPESKPLGVMTVRLNSTAIYRSIRQDGLVYGGSAVYIYDGGGEPVFPSLLVYPKREELLVGPEQSEEGGNAVYPAGDGYFLVSRSEATGWIFLQRMEAITVIPDASDLLKALGTYGLVALGLLLLASYYLILRIYRPFRQLLLSLISRSRREGEEEFAVSDSSEWELIQDIATDHSEQNARFRAILQSVGESLSENMFARLLSDRECDAGIVRETMEQIESPFPLDGEYLVLEFRFWPKEKEGGGPVDAELYGLQLTRVCQEFWEEKYLGQMVGIQEGEKSLILCPRQKKSETMFCREVELFRKFLNRSLDSQPFAFEMGSSGLCGSLFELWELRRQAREELQQRIYYSEKEKQRQEESSVVIQEYRKAADQILQPFLRRPGKDNPLEGVLMRAAKERPGQALLIYRALGDLFIEKMVQLRAPISDHMRLLRRKLEQADPKDGVPEDTVNDFFSEGVEVLRRAGRKEQYAHIEEAKRWIEEQYFDSSLSLESIGEQLGLTAPYLSRLFTEYQPPGFLDYLNRCRLERAKQLLEETDYNIGEIGFKTGFNSSQNFIRVFKRYEGETPGQFRQRRKEEAEHA